MQVHSFAKEASPELSFSRIMLYRSIPLQKKLLQPTPPALNGDGMLICGDMPCNNFDFNIYCWDSCVLFKNNDSLSLDIQYIYPVLYCLHIHECSLLFTYTLI